MSKEKDDKDDDDYCVIRINYDDYATLTERQVLERLTAELEVLAAIIKNPNEFVSLQIIMCCCLTNHILAALCELFDTYAASKNKKHHQEAQSSSWKSLVFFIGDEEQQQQEEDFSTTLLYHVLRIANEASLFASIKLDFYLLESFLSKRGFAVWILLPSLSNKIID